MVMVVMMRMRETASEASAIITSDIITADITIISISITLTLIVTVTTLFTITTIIITLRPCISKTPMSDFTTQGFHREACWRSREAAVRFSEG